MLSIPFPQPDPEPTPPAPQPNTAALIREHVEAILAIAATARLDLVGGRDLPELFADASAWRQDAALGNVKHYAHNVLVSLDTYLEAQKAA